MTAMTNRAQVIATFVIETATQNFFIYISMQTCLYIYIYTKYIFGYGLFSFKELERFMEALKN